MAVKKVAGKGSVKMSIRVEDGTNLSNLYKAVKEFENETKLTVLSLYVNKLHESVIETTDGIIVIKWSWNINEFMNGIVSNDVVIIEVLPYICWLAARRKTQTKEEQERE